MNGSHTKARLVPHPMPSTVWPERYLQPQACVCVQLKAASHIHSHYLLLGWYPPSPKLSCGEGGVLALARGAHGRMLGGTPSSPGLLPTECSSECQQQSQDEGPPELHLLRWAWVCAGAAGIAGLLPKSNGLLCPVYSERSVS